MTREEFNQFAKRLFAEYPSIHGWLKYNSPDMAATLGHWFRILESYAYADCNSVLDRWQKTSSEPFGSYSKDHVPYAIRAVLDRDRDRARAKAKQQREAELRRQVRDAGFSLTRRFDKSMKEAYEQLRPYRLQLDDGEISQVEYQRMMDSILEGV